MIFQPKPRLGTVLNRKHKLAKGLVGCWLMNEGTGNTVFDLSGNGNHGTINGADWVPGGLDFVSANSDYINIGDGNGVFDFTEAMTIYAQVKMHDGASFPMLISKGYATTWAASFANITEKNRFYLTVGGSSHANSGTIVQPLNEWSTVSYVYGNGYQRSYVNGTLDLNRVQTGTMDTNSINVHIGGDFPSTSYHFNGIIAYIYLYNRSLLMSEIEDLNNDPYQMFVQPTDYTLMCYETLSGVTIPVIIKHLKQQGIL